MLILSGLLCVLIIYSFLKLISFFHFARMLQQLPGRKGYPILGNSLDFIGPAEKVFSETRSYMEDFQKQGVCRLWLLYFPLLLVFDPEICEKIMGSVSNNRKGIIYKIFHPWLGNGLLTSFGSHWHARRKLLTPAFHFNILQKYLSIFNSKSRILVEDIKKKGAGEQEVNTLITKFTLDSICETAFGGTATDSKDGDVYLESLHEYGKICFERVRTAWMMVDFLFFFSRFYWIQRKAVKILHKFSTDMIRRRKFVLQEAEKNNSEFATEKKQLALLDLLVEAQRNGDKIDDIGIREEVDTFMFEGHDTTGVSLGFTLMLLANNRQCQDKIHQELLSVMGEDDEELTNAGIQELKYLERCIKESLRLYPSVPLITRKLGEDIKTEKGFILPKGSTVMVFIYDLHRRPDLYTEPEKFDPDRFLLEKNALRHPYAFIPFSAGPRNCIGQKFALMEMKCALAAILRNFILEPVDTPETCECISDIVTRTKNPIRVKFVPRK